MVKLPTSGREISEDTIVEALKNLCVFDENKYEFKPGDVAISETWNREIRIIVIDANTLKSFSDNGRYMSDGQVGFEKHKYTYVGRISDFINEETIKKLLSR